MAKSSGYQHAGSAISNLAGAAGWLVLGMPKKETKEAFFAQPLEITNSSR